MPDTPASSDTARPLSFREIPAREAKVGDLLANQATITSVVMGPKTAKAYADKWLRPGRGETTIRCGDSFGWKLKNARLIVVGRREWQS